MRKGSGKILLAVVVGGLLAGLALWKGGPTPGAPANAAPPPAQTAAAPKAEAAAFTPGRAQPYHGAIPAPSAREQRCEAARRARLRAELATIQSEASASAALDHALLADAIGFPQPGASPQARKIERAASAHRWEAARKRWPADLDIAWFAALNCHTQHGCDRDAAVRHLLALDDRNAAAWLIAIQDVRARGDINAYWRLVHEAALQARFSDPRTGTVYLHMKPLLIQASPTPECISAGDTRMLAKELGRAPTLRDYASVEAFGSELAVPAPWLAALSECRQQPLSSEQRRDCIGLLKHVAEGETMLEQGYGLAMLIPLVGEGPAGNRLRERYREFRWLGAVGRRLPPFGELPDEVWAQGEVALMRQRAEAARLWPPPPGWLPADANGRSLILSGRRQ